MVGDMKKTTPGPSGGINAAIAAVLNGERTASRLTYDQLAQETGINVRTLKRMLSSLESDIDVNVLEALAAAFNLTPSQAMERAEEWQARHSA